MIRVVSPGLYASVQDEGRRGLRRFGVPWAGALVPAFLHGANALAGNRAGAPAVECFEGGLELALEAPARLVLACLGPGALEAIGDDGATRALAPWCAHHLGAGTRVRVRATGAGRVAILAIRGLAVEPVHGSASTYPRAGLGGLDGRALAAGDVLPCASAPPGPGLRVAPAALARLEAALLGTTADGSGAGSGPGPRGDPNDGPGDDPDDGPGDGPGGADAPFATVRAVPGPQRDAFAPGALDALFAPAGWRVSAATDRMGARLEGAPLEHRDAGSRDIVSDAIVPGSVQVPGTGLPICLLADAHTAGGYPKIATVASADLAAVALARPGARLRLARTDPAGAVARARALHAAAAAALADTVAVAAPLDPARLLSENLVDGVTDGNLA